MTVHAALLDDRGVLTVSGPDARPFLQGLLTLDMEKVAPGKAQAGALLSPQGKILFDLIVLEQEGRFWIETTAAKRDELIKRLHFYKLRAKIEIAPQDGWAVMAFWPEAPATIGFSDPRLPALGRRAFVEKNKYESLVNTTQAKLSSVETYHANRIALGVPEAEKDYALEDTFPHDANFDLLHGVDFEKGCYIGQEVVSRMQHRGQLRKRIVSFRFDGVAPATGTPIMAGGKELGRFGSSAEKRALGLVRTDRLEEAMQAGAMVMAGSARLERRKES